MSRLPSLGVIGEQMETERTIAGRENDDVIFLSLGREWSQSEQGDECPREPDAGVEQVNMAVAKVESRVDSLSG